MKKKTRVKKLMSHGFERNLAKLMLRADKSSVEYAFGYMDQEFYTTLDCGGVISAKDSHTILAKLEHSMGIKKSWGEAIFQYNMYVYRHRLNNAILNGSL